MIHKNVLAFCSEDIKLIENYEAAISDETQTWDCHHRREIDENKSRQQLKDEGLYFNRPANELIFLTKFDHRSLHFKGKASGFKGHNHSEETKKRMRESSKGIIPWNKGKKGVQDYSNRHSTGMLGKQHSEKTKNKISESQKNRLAHLGKSAWNKDLTEKQMNEYSKAI